MENLCKQIAAIEKEKQYQYSPEAVEKLERKIIDLIDQFLLSENPEYRAASAEYERLGALIDGYVKIIDYIKALDEAIKQTRGAVGAQLGDFVIPGEIGTIGSTLQTRIASQAQNKAASIFSSIPDKTGKEVMRVGDTNLTDILEGLDIVFDALRRSGGLDITSLVNAANNSLKAGDIKKAIQLSLDIVDKMDAPELERKFNNMENIIKKSISEVRQKCVV